MKTTWFNGLKGEEKENFHAQIVNASNVLDKLREIVYNRVKEVQGVSRADYDCASWSHRQAHQNGQVEALTEVLALLDLGI